MADSIRIQKYLSRAGRASRREAERLLEAGRISVNGVVVTELGSRIVPGQDQVAVDGELVELPDIRWLALNKPAGVLTTRSDPHGGRTVYDVLPPDASSLRYVGRLDRETEGVLLLTNDGDVLHGLTHPSREVEREYLALVVGIPTSATLARLRSGVTLEDGPARARDAAVAEAQEKSSLVRLVLTEGRNREVRRLLEAVGHPVRELKRVRFGPVTLGDLPPGGWRPLSDDECRRLREAAEAP